MTRPMFRLTVGHLMLGVAALGLFLVLVRVNGALAVVVACVSTMTLARTVHSMRRRRALGVATPPWRWLRVGVSSLVVSTAIIGSGDLTFMFVYGVAEAIRRGGAAHPPPAELNGAGLLVGVPSGIVVGYTMRRWLWQQRSVPRRLRLTRRPSRPAAQWADLGGQSAGPAKRARRHTTAGACCRPCARPHQPVDVPGSPLPRRRPRGAARNSGRAPRRRRPLDKANQCRALRVVHLGASVRLTAGYRDRASGTSKSLGESQRGESRSVGFDRDVQLHTLVR